MLSLTFSFSYFSPTPPISNTTFLPSYNIFCYYLLRLGIEVKQVQEKFAAAPRPAARSPPAPPPTVRDSPPPPPRARDGRNPDWPASVRASPSPARFWRARGQSRARSASRSISPASGMTSVASSSTTCAELFGISPAIAATSDSAGEPPYLLHPSCGARQRSGRRIAQQDRRHACPAARSSRRERREPALISRTTQSSSARAAAASGISAGHRPVGADQAERRRHSRTGPTVPRSRTVSPDAAGAG